MALERQGRSGDDDGASVEAVVRLAAGTARNTTQWAVSTGFGLGRRMLQAATSPENAMAFAKDVATAAKVLVDGVSDVVESRLDPERDDDEDGFTSLATSSRRVSPVDQGTELRVRGNALLERSRDVWDESSSHPAYARILDDLAPDEARILTHLLRGGPQPSVDVRTGGPVGMVSSTLIAPGLNMIGPRAGVRHLDQVPSYLNNLFRLGLVWFSREQLRDPLEYQVVEAQPDVLAAMHSVKFAKVVRRSIHLTPFGEDFCRACLVDVAEDLTELPEHQAPHDLE